MEECESAGREHPWKEATTKRKAWARSRDSWQASESQDAHAEVQPSQESAAHQEPLAAEPGRFPNKIASWLKECRTPLGASLDEQSSTTAKVKNACSFEDDLSLGAEADHLRAGRAQPEVQRVGMLAQEKRTQFQQKGRSMNSTGSGKSNTTVSSVSELLDLYEEDPEEILYNLGFGREEPDIASKIPSRFFNGTSHARGIDIKVYLGAQLQRLELENPNYALTSRFRQIEVLTTVANAFSSLYSQVSGAPVQKIGTSDPEPKEVPLLSRNNSALNAAKLLKKTFTRRNLLAAADEALAARVEAESGKESSESSREQAPKSKEQQSLTTVTEEGRAGDAPKSDLPNGNLLDHSLLNGSPPIANLPNGDPPNVGIPDDPLSASLPSCNEEEPVEDPGLTPPKDSSLAAEHDSDKHGDQAVTSTPTKEPSAQRAHPSITHLLSQAKDSFEMEEVQSNEGEGLTGIIGSSKKGNEPLLRMASQHSDSSGFAEDPSTDGSANHLKVQESSDSCDSETTVTSNAGDLNTPLALDHPAFQKLQGEDQSLMVINADRPAGMDNLTSQELERVNGGQTVTGSDSNVEPSAGSPGGNEDNPDGEEEMKAIEEEADQKRLVEKEVDEENVGEAQVVETESVEDGGAEELIPEYIPHPIPQPTERVTLTPQPVEPRSPEGPGSPAEPEGPAQVRSAVEAGSEDAVDEAPTNERGPPQEVSEVSQEHKIQVQARVQDPHLGRGRYPLRRASSLPVSLLSPAKVVSSVKIQLRPGSAHRCTPPSFTYRYATEDGEDDTGSILEEDEDEEQEPRHPSMMMDSGPKERDLRDELRAEDVHLGRMPRYPMQPSAHLTHSMCSLHSVPPDWPEHPACDLPRSWSTCSMPALSAHSAPYGSPGLQPHSAPHAMPRPPPHTSPHRLPHPAPHSAPYGPALGPSPYGPQGPPLGHFPGLPYNYGIMHGNRYHYPPNPAYYPPYGLLNCCPTHHAAWSPLAASNPSPARLAQPPSGVEMQLRRVLHDVRSAVQNLSQSPSLQGEDVVDPVFRPHRAVQPLYEDTIQELQVIKSNLNVFRTQMMDLELALLRQQDMVYQHLSEEDRQEAEHLQNLRTAVRREVQELELQLEDRLLFLDEQLRTAPYRHPVEISRGHSLDSPCSTPPMNVSEPVSELLREQLSLQAELGFEGRAGSVPLSAHSSSSGLVSPGQPSRARGPNGPEVYRSSVSLTPTLPPRPQASETPQRAESTPPSAPPEEREAAGPEGAAGNTQFQQLIKEIKQRDHLLQRKSTICEQAQVSLWIKRMSRALVKVCTGRCLPLALCEVAHVCGRAQDCVMPTTLPCIIHIAVQHTSIPVHCYATSLHSVQSWSSWMVRSSSWTSLEDILLLRVFDDG
ncbi:hypothetical protein GJAV_G00204120 [Gymnothorax javanicus]|nr:hypothetical protein GJAV_G00204120 [Gymnothorax javanicus]